MFTKKWSKKIATVEVRTILVQIVPRVWDESSVGTSNGCCIGKRDSVMSGGAAGALNGLLEEDVGSPDSE